MIYKKEVYRRILDTYEKEMRPLIKELPCYLREDKELFRVKMHGLKGASRQLGKQEISDFAEQMEMAVRDDNMAYIYANIEYFLQVLESVLEEIASQRDAIPVIKKEVPQNYSINELFLELKKAFDSYNLKQIENVLSSLEEIKLNEAQTKLLQQLQEACNELEYEKGSQLLREIDEAVGGGKR
ncbi:MAG: hypothetical protein IJO85_05830 [Lachnospiraceae bacterium]|nr:hypothetical protein [Lachnospiraceae bacterium]